MNNVGFNGAKGLVSSNDKERLGDKNNKGHLSTKL